MKKHILLATAVLVIGATAYGQNGKVGIGTTNPQAKLHIEAGNTPATIGTGLKLVDGSQGHGKTLVSDSFGNARWSNTPYDDRGKIFYNGPVPAVASFNNVGLSVLNYTFPAPITLSKGSWLVYAQFRIDGYNIVNPGGVTVVASSGSILVNSSCYASSYSPTTWFGFVPIQVDVTTESATIKPKWIGYPSPIDANSPSSINIGVATTSPSNPCLSTNNYGCLPFFAVPLKD